MNINQQIMALCLLLAGLTGCSQPGPVSNVTPFSPPAAAVKEEPAETDPQLKLRLERCLFEAKQLQEMSNGAYKQQVDTLYRSIQATKLYAGIAGQISDSTTEMVTPLYQFRINDACNTIAQSLLGELKKGISGTQGGNP